MYNTEEFTKLTLKMNHKDEFYRIWVFDHRINDPLGDPPYRQLRKSSNTDRGKRGAVIGADAFGQPVAVKQGLEDLATLMGAGARDDLATKQIAADMVHDRQRIAAGAVFGVKLTFKVGTPDNVGRSRRGKRLGTGLHIAPATSWAG